MFDKIMERCGRFIAPLIAALLVATGTKALADNYAPLGAFLQGVGSATCATDAGAGLCLDASGYLVGIASTVNEAITWAAEGTFSAAGTGLAVSHNATVGGTLAVTGQGSFNAAAGTGMSVLSNAVVTGSTTSNQFISAGTNPISLSNAAPTILNTATGTTTFNCATTSTSACYTFSATSGGSTGATAVFGGSVPIALSGDTNGNVLFTINQTPSTTLAQVALTSLDSTGCPSGTNEFISFVSPTAGFDVLCSGKGQFKAGLAVSGGSLAETGSITYSQLLIDNAACGTAASGQATGSTCNGDSGFVTASGGVASITLGNPYSNLNKMQCQVQDYGTGTPGTGLSTWMAFTYTASTITVTSPTNTHIYGWHCFGINGG